MDHIKHLKKEEELFEEGDIVVILSPEKERGRYAIILRSALDLNGVVIFTLKMNSYWNSSENVKYFGLWIGQLWIAVIKFKEEIQVRKKSKDR